MSLRPTVTTNRLHFSDLDPLRFEEICYMLVSRYQNWLELIHLGRSGADGGIDIKGKLQLPSGMETWLIQCKRYQNIGIAELKQMVDKILLNHSIPDKLMLIVSCEVSRAKYDEINRYAAELGIPALIIWTDTTLEDKLYQHPEIKTLAFGQDFGSKNRSKENAQKISRGLKMGRRLEKVLFNKNVIGNSAYRERLMLDPSLKFKTEDVYIRSVDDTTYPDRPLHEKVKISPWFRTFFYDTYHNGIELYLSAGRGADVIMDKNGFWQHVIGDDARKDDPAYKLVPVRIIARIPYSGIMDFIPDDESGTSCPHLFCLYDRGGLPYEEIYYQYDDGHVRLFGNALDRAKETVFPQAAGVSGS